MIIGTRRAEEARVFDSQKGYHQFHNEDGEAYGSFEVFWSEDYFPNYTTNSGWYWWLCHPGCLPDSCDLTGPFGSSSQARQDADEFWQD